MKMKSICVVGNSHISALKGGWELIKDEYPSQQIRFFGGLKKSLMGLDNIDGKLGLHNAEDAEFFKKISGTDDFLNPDDYDVFLLAGMGLYANAIINNYWNYATPSTKNSVSAEYFISDEAYEDMFWQEVNDGMMLHVARTIRKVTKKKIYISWQPFLSEQLFQIEWRAKLFEPILANDDYAFIYRNMQIISQRLKDEGFDVLIQPAESITRKIMTKEDYSVGSVLLRPELNQKHKELDVFHMNAEYGKLCWQMWDIR